MVKIIFMGMVAIEKCPNYNSENLLKALNAIFESLGGVEKFIKPGMKVVLKPNLVIGKRPEHAATTHPELVKAVAAFVKNAGAGVTIADSPGGALNEKMLSKIYDVCGMTKIAEEMGIKLNLDLSQVNIPNPAGKYLKKVTVIKYLVDADIIINIPKLKTHWMMVYSGAVKNMFGAVPGLLKAEHHLRMPEYDKFADSLIDIFLSVKPTLNIMDAITGMEGNGPTAGNPKVIGYIMASEDAFELDFAALGLINVNPVDVPILKQAINRGLCPAKFENIKITGADINKIAIKDFKIPQVQMLKNVQFFDRGILRFIAAAIKPKPVFSGKRCTGCCECIRNCPVQIIQLKGVKRKRPAVDLKKCIRCFCCQELCPSGAVSVKRRFIFDFWQHMNL